MAIINNPPLINGVAKSHASIGLTIAGIPIIGCTAIEYSDIQAIEPNYSNTQLPTSVGFGGVQMAATITLTLEAVEVISNLAPDGRIQNIPFFDVRVNYFETEGGFFVSHRLVNCKFKGRNITSAVDNSQIAEALELFVSDIRYN